MPCKKPNRGMPHKDFHPRLNHHFTMKRDRIETESGIPLPYGTWPMILVKIRARYDSFTELQRYCRRFNLKFKPIFLNSDDEDWKDVTDPDEPKRMEAAEKIQFSDKTLHFHWYEVWGGPAVSCLTDEQKDGGKPPFWVVEWSPVSDVPVPRARSSTFPTHIHCPKPRNKVRGFKWHEAGQEWMEMQPQDLSEAQQLGLGKEPKITNLMGKVVKDGVTPFVWMLGRKFPLKWDFETDEWVDAESLPDKGKVPQPVLCKEWFGKSYMWFWVRPDRTNGGHERSQYFQSSMDAENMIDHCTWYGEKDADGFAESDNLPDPPVGQSGKYIRSEEKEGDGWVGGVS